MCKWSIFGQPLNVAIAEAPAAPVAKKVVQPAPRTEQVKASGVSKATRVREFIAQAKKSNQTQQHVVAICISQLGMTRALAATYVKNNWDKV